MPRWAAPAFALVLLTLPAAAVEPNETPALSPAHGRGEAGYEYDRVHGVPLQMGNAGLTIRVNPTQPHWGIYAGAYQSVGKSEYGLTVWKTSARALVDYQLGRLHLGLEPRLSLLGVQRRSEEGTMYCIRLGVVAALGFDVIRIREHSAVQLLARGGGDLLEKGSVREAKSLIALGYSVSLAYSF